MMLSCAPAVLALMRGGPSKASAETLAWTMGAPPPDARRRRRRRTQPTAPRPRAGSALGIEYLVERSRRRAPSGARMWLLCTSE